VPERTKAIDELMKELGTTRRDVGTEDDYPSHTDAERAVDARFRARRIMVCMLERGRAAQLCVRHKPRAHEWFFNAGSGGALRSPYATFWNHE
jgi:hypothetical protein